MAYERINWQNEPSEATALNDVNLNKMDSAIYDHDQRLDTAESDIGNIETALDNKVDKVNGKGLSQVDNVTVTQHAAYGTVVSTIKTYKQDGTEVTSQVCNGIVVDSALSNSSTNPVQNKVVKSAIDEKSTVAISDTLETGTTLANITIDGTTTAIKGSDIEVDEELSPTSTNPVENKAIYDALNNLLPSKTVSGNPISISDASGFNSKALKVTMNPIQSGSGDPSPTNIRPISGRTEASVFESGINLWDLSACICAYISANGTTVSENTNYLCDKFYFVKKGKSITLSSKNNCTRMCISAFNTSFNFIERNQVSSVKQISYTATDDCYVKVHFNYDNTERTVDEWNALCDTIELQLQLGDIVLPYEPFKKYTAITHQYSETIYGGVDDFVNGGLSNEWGYITSYDGETLPGEWISDRDVYAPDTTPTTGAEVAYKLATPTTISTSAEEITLLKGNNVLSTNADDMELKYSVSLDSLLS